jgi:hypothetical protein
MKGAPHEGAPFVLARERSVFFFQPDEQERSLLHLNTGMTLTARTIVVLA